MVVLLSAVIAFAGVQPQLPKALEDAEARGRFVEEAPPTVSGPPVVIRGGTVLTATGIRHAPGFVVLRDGRIEATGPGEPPDVDGAVIVDATGRFVTPGLIDTHSHLGVYASPGSTATGDGNEMTAPTTPGVWAEHSTWPQDPGIVRAVAGGITAFEILPGSANLIGGQGFVVQAVPTRGSRAMAFPGAPETVKMACGENPKRVYGEKSRAPSTRMGNLRGQREAFMEAEEYLRTWQDYDRKLTRWQDWPDQKHKKSESRGEEPRPPSRDLDMETLVDLMTGKALAEVHCYRADDMLAFLQLADEFRFSVRSFHHALEAYKIRDVLAAKGVAVSTWADWWGFKMEAYDGIPYNLALLDRAGVDAIVHSDSDIGIQRLNQEAGKGLAAGRRAGLDVDEDDAIRWVTINPARALGIGEQTGSIEPGKRADVVVWSADPFSVYAEADLVFIEGVLRWDADRPQIWSDFEIGREVAP